MTAATPPYRWATLYVDAADPATVVADVRRLLDVPPSDLDVFTVPGFTADVRPNPDRTQSGQVLDWRTMIEVDAAPDVPDLDVVAFVTRLVAHLRAAGHRVAVDSDFTDELR
ncbi:MAG: hypothetical protein ACJ73E_02655 [Mycobacteriales bacterium]